jgi:PAS domain S-box-containing protein
MKLQRTMHLRRNRSLDQRAAHACDSRRILHSASDAILSVGHDTTILLANPAAARMFDTGVAGLQGSPLARFIVAPGADARTPPDYFPAGLGRAGRRATDYAVTGIRSDGERFPIEGSISSVELEGRPIYTVILRDVSERHLVQQTLARSHDQLRQLSSALQSIREEERTHIARELHDDLGQLLASLSSACLKPARPCSAAWKAICSRPSRRCAGSPPTCARAPSTKAGCTSRCRACATNSPNATASPAPSSPMKLNCGWTMPPAPPSFASYKKH